MIVRVPDIWKGQNMQKVMLSAVFATSLLLCQPTSAHEHETGHDHGRGEDEHGMGHGDGHGDGHRDGHATVGGAPAPYHTYDRTITVDASDIAFDMDKIKVKDGETIRFVIVNSGELEHEFNIGTQDMHMDHQEEMVAMMDQMMAGQGMHHAHGNSVFLLPGETRVLVWKFEHAHDLQFACNVPGHYESGMHGEFVFTH